MNLRENIIKILREEFNQSIRRRVKFGEIDKFVNRNMVSNFKKDEPIENSINSTINDVVNEVMFGVFVDDDVQFHKLWHEFKSFIRKKYTDDLRQYFERRQKEVDHGNNEMDFKYIFVKHDKPYLQGNWRGFQEGFDSFDDMITKYGGWIDVDWDEVKQKLDSIKNFPENTFTGRYNSAPLSISKVGDEGNTWGYNFSVIKSIPKENVSKVKDIQTEGLHDTSWENDKGDKITLIDLLNATGDIPVQKISVEELKPHLLSWDGNEDEIKKIERADLQYPILIFVDDDGSFISIIDGHHRAQKAVRKGLETIKAKIIPINSLPKDIRKVFSHMGRQEEMNEGELTERCWKGYTQKGMKTMFGKRYPNCVKKTK